MFMKSRGHFSWKEMMSEMFQKDIFNTFSTNENHPFVISFVSKGK